MADTLPVLFIWDKLRPDQREYRQQSSELLPENVYIQIDVPADPIYVIPGKNPAEIILTLTGMKYVIDQFDTVFLPPKKQEPNADDDWEDDKSTEESPASEKDDWDSDADFDSEKETDKVPWNDDGDDWS